MKYDFLPIEPPPWVAEKDWHDWKWQFKNSLKNKEDFASYFELTNSESQAFVETSDLFQIRVSPYYARVADKKNSRDPIRQILMPSSREVEPGVQSMDDPLGEKRHCPVARIIHRYPDRVLFLLTDLCSVYCRYCTRKHFTGQDQVLIKKSEYKEALSYISSQPGVREVILSGGDPLTLSNNILDRVLTDLRMLDNVEIIRVASRQPVVNPARITEELALLFRKHKPVFMMTHFNHPKEITLQSAQALEQLVDHGVPVFNQMVLLNGINNHPAIVQALSRRLLYLRVKPYYMFHCDPSRGTDHFRTSIEDSMEIQRELWGRLSGLAMPNLSLDIPGGGGKVPITPNFEVAHAETGRVYKGWDGHQGEYKNPIATSIQKPEVPKEYLQEWESCSAPIDSL